MKPMKDKKKNKKKIIKSLNQKFEEKKLLKLKKHGLNRFKCVGGCHEPDGCGFEWNTEGEYVDCPKCGNPYCVWINFTEPT